MRAFKVFKLAAGCIFKCQPTKEKLAKDIKQWVLKEGLFYNVIYNQILMLFKFLIIFYVPH